MSRARHKTSGLGPAGLLRDQAGQVTLEWTLILAVMVIPMIYVFRLCLGLLAGRYEMMSFMNSMPFP